MNDSGCRNYCPGCAHRHMSQRESLDRKDKWLAKMLSPWSDHIDPVCPPEDADLLRYRNKTCLSAAWEQTGWKFGLIRRDRIIDLHNCPVHSHKIESAVGLFVRCLPPFSSFPLVYYVQSGAQVTLVVKQKTMPDVSWLDENFNGQLKEIGIEGLWLHLNPGAGRNVFAKNDWRLLWGMSRSKNNSGFVYGPRSFQQPILSLFQKAMGSAEAFLIPRRNDLMADLYCGSGVGLKRWSDRGCRVIGVETDGEAVECAKINAPSAVVLRGKCKDRIPQLMEWADADPVWRQADRLAFVNPPRTGLEPETIQWLLYEYRPVRTAYLSCSIGTLHRDLQIIEAAGFVVHRIIPYDFFPWTHHVECLVLAVAGPLVAPRC
jgi:23S rRNA (uracil1939-C5)-methyltransferase